MEVTKVTSTELRDRLKNGQLIVFIDARSQKAWKGSDVKVPGAIRIPKDELEQHLKEIPPDRPIVAYCT